MAATSYFDEDRNGKLSGSAFGEPDGTQHEVELLEGNGHMILRVSIGGANQVDLLFTDEQAVAFTAAVESITRRLGLDES